MPRKRPTPPPPARPAPTDNITPPINFGAASTTAPYKTPAWNVRVGGNDHAKFKSRGF